jgi:hypothetical protein
MTLRVACKLCSAPVSVEIDGEFFTERFARLVVCNGCA